MEPLRAHDPTRVGRYELQARLGEGGMGTVYQGRSRSGRLVAVKVVKDGLAHDPVFLRRFAREVEAARLVGCHHTAGVVDADLEADPPWLVTTYIKGRSLAQALDADGPLDAEGLRRLGAGLAESLEAIHEAWLVHRDLKPSNVLMTDDGPRVIDFGIARALDETTIRQKGGVPGTPGFMAPEQIEGTTVESPCDVFCLGLVLCYAAGVRPFGAVANVQVMLNRILNKQPDLSGVPEQMRDLVMDCLARVPGHRPSAADVLRRLADAVPAVVPQTAIPPAPPGRAGPTAAMDSPFVGTPAVAGAAAPAFQAPRPPPLTGFAALPTSTQEPHTLVVKPAEPKPAPHRPSDRAFVVGLPVTLPGNRISAQPDRRRPRTSAARPPVLDFMWGEPPTQTASHIHAVSTTPVRPPAESTAAIRPVPTRRTLLASGVVVLAAVVGAAAALGPKTRHPSSTRPPADIPTPTSSVSTAEPNPAASLLTVLTDATGWASGVTLRPDGALLAEVSHDNTIRLWSMADLAQPPITLGDPSSPGNPNYWISSLAFRSDGAMLVVQGEDRGIELWNVADPTRAVRMSVNHISDAIPDRVFSMAISTDRRTLAVGTEGGNVRLWNVSDPAKPVLLAPVLTGHTDVVTSLAFRPDGRILASGSDDKTVRLWDMADPGNPTPSGDPLVGHTSLVKSVTFSPNGHTLASGSYDQSVRLWNVADPKQPGPIGQPLAGHEDRVTRVAISPDSKTLASGSFDATVRLWDISDPSGGASIGRPLLGHAWAISSLAFSSDRRTLASTGGDSTVRLWRYPG